MVQFGEFGDVLKVSCPTDFSLARLTGLAPEATTETVAHVLRELGYELSASCVRILPHSPSSQTEATVKVEDPLFAEGLSIRLATDMPELRAVPVPVNSSQTSCRKLKVSWHKATRSVRCNFSDGKIASSVAEKFNEGKYKCLSQSVTSSDAKEGLSGRFSYNPLAWTIIISNVPGMAGVNDIKQAIKLKIDAPGHIVPGPISYRSSESEVRAKVPKASRRLWPS